MKGRRGSSPAAPRKPPVLSQAEVVVLSLLLRQPRHGYDIVRRIEDMKARMWAKIGASTVYVVLDRLRKSGAVKVERQADSLGPAKRVVSITPKGRAQLAESVRSLLRSGASVYSDRIVGLAMSSALSRREARQEVAATTEFVARALADLEAYRNAEAKSPTSALVVGFYRDVLRAELRACERWMVRAGQP